MNYNENEEWVRIPGDFDKEYQISRNGSIRYFFVSITNRPNRYKYLGYTHAKIGYGNGYIYVCLKRKGKWVTIALHRLLAITFIPNPENKSQVNHIDGNSLNNDLSNLEWVTPKENINHAWDSGLVKRNAARITDTIVLSVKRLHAKKWRQKDIAERLGISAAVVGDIVNNKRRFANNQN